MPGDPHTRYDNIESYSHPGLVKGTESSSVMLYTTGASQV